MRVVPVLTPREAADLVPDGAVITVSSSSGLGCPDATLRGIRERYDDVAAPRAVTTVHPIAAGDMYGILGIDHLAVPGLLRRVVAGSHPSVPSGEEPPRI
jgi:acyl CoA:acetate/3-ketoacid CoA transferase